MMAETVVAFQSQLSGVLEALFKAAMFEITRLVEDSFLEEASRCKEQVDTLKRKLKISESRRKQREAADLNQKCSNCGSTGAGSTNATINEVQTANVKQEIEVPADVSKKLNKTKRSSDLQDMIVVKSDTYNEDEPSVSGASHQLSNPENQLKWEAQFNQSHQSEVNCGKTNRLSKPFGEDSLDNQDNNSICKDSNITAVEVAASVEDDEEDDDLVFMGPIENVTKHEMSDKQQTHQAGENNGNDGASTSANITADIECLLINEEGHLQDELIHSGNTSSDRTDDVLGEPNTITDISQMIELLQQQSMENGLHTCSLCLATFPDSDTLNAHKQMHKEPECGLPYLCNLRRKTFARNGNLKSSGPHGCGLCGKTFPSLVKLQKHNCEQTGDKPYSCAICGNKFSRLWNLKLHQRIHTQEKPHHCTMCNKSFTRADILKVHQRTHTGERPYCCLVCGLNFKRLDHLKSHQRKHMPDQ